MKRKFLDKVRKDFGEWITTHWTNGKEGFNQMVEDVVNSDTVTTLQEAIDEVRNKPKHWPWFNVLLNHNGGFYE